MRSFKDKDRRQNTDPISTSASKNTCTMNVEIMISFTAGPPYSGETFS